MRFGMAKLATSFTDFSQKTASKRIIREVIETLSKDVEIPQDEMGSIKLYLNGKPGSPKYTPLNKALKSNKLSHIQQQDYWLSQSQLKSSVGALTKNYFEDSLQLAYILKMVKPNQNIRLNRGIMSLFDPKSGLSPFELSQNDEILLGIWLIDIDGDWIITFLKELDEKNIVNIGLENRVKVFLGTVDRLLDSREFRSGSSDYISIRKRLLKLRDTTLRNIKEGLNIGQPWSWFLIPRLELLIDAGFLEKSQQGKLHGYSLSSFGKILQKSAIHLTRGKELLEKYFSSLRSQNQIPLTDLKWKDIELNVKNVMKKFRSPSGYYPLFEITVAVCLERYNSTDELDRLWDIPIVESAIHETGSGEESAVLLGIDRHGRVRNFKIK